MIGAAATTADTPRAHITSAAALECLRDVGLEEACIESAADGATCMAHTRWCRSMAGEEFARTYSWGNDPARHVRCENFLCDVPISIPGLNSGFSLSHPTSLQMRN